MLYLNGLSLVSMLEQGRVRQRRQERLRKRYEKSP